MTLAPAQLFFSPDISGPNNSQLSPLNRIADGLAGKIFQDVGGIDPRLDARAVCTIGVTLPAMPSLLFSAERKKLSRPVPV
jgi:hypothetical protein